MFGLFKSAGERIGENAATMAIATFVKGLNKAGLYIAREDEIKPECLRALKARAAKTRHE